MAKKVSVDAKNVHHLIHQAYLAGGKYQWVREGLVNALQADAKWIHFGIEESGYKRRGVLRRYIADNGLGMEPEQIDVFLSSFGGGGREVSDHQNFGQGFKSSCYEWNPFGIIVLSWTQNSPEGVMIWIHQKKDSAGNITWELRDFEVATSKSSMGVDEVVHKLPPNQQVLDQVGVDLETIHFERIRESGHGTVFLFLGDGASRDTAAGDYLREEESSTRGIIQYINKRFISLPNDVEITVENLEAKKKGSERRDTKDKYIEGPGGEFQGVHNRRAKGLKSFIPADSKFGQFEITKNTEVKWFLAPAGEKAVSGGDGPSKSQIVLNYDGEGYEIRDSVRDFRSFGVMDSIRQRVWLILTPPKGDSDDRTSWGVFPQGSRGSLVAADGEKLPWEEWFDSFYKNFPPELQEAINKASQSESSIDQDGKRDRLKRVMDRFSSRFRPRMVVESNAGDVKGVDSGSRTGTPRDLGGEMGDSSPNPHEGDKQQNEDSGGDGVIRIIRTDESGSETGQVKVRSDGIPAIRWDETFGEDDDRYAAARFDAKEKVTNKDLTVTEGVIHMNVNFPLFQDEVRYWTEKYPQAPEGKIEEIVRSIYEEEVTSKVLHARKLMATPVAEDERGKKVRVTQEQIDRWTSPESLTSGLLGLVNVDLRITTLASSNFGRSRTSGF